MNKPCPYLKTVLGNSGVRVLHDPLGRTRPLWLARRISGHSDASRIPAYLGINFPGKTVSDLETAYAVERLREFDARESRGAVDASWMNRTREEVQRRTGHNDPLGIQTYLKLAFPEQELSRLEEQYAVERLRELDASGNDGAIDASGLNMLYEKVLLHFGAKSLSAVLEAELCAYMAVLRKNDGFALEPHAIYANNGVDVVCIFLSFVIRRIHK